MEMTRNKVAIAAAIVLLTCVADAGACDRACGDAFAGDRDRDALQSCHR